MQRPCLASPTALTRYIQVLLQCLVLILGGQRDIAMNNLSRGGLMKHEMILIVSQLFHTQKYN